MSFFHLDSTIGKGITPFQLALAYYHRRSGISPCPEDFLFNYDGSIARRQVDCKTILQTGTKPGRSDFLGGRFSWWDGWYTLANGNFPLTHAVTHEQKNRGGNNGEKRICG